MIASFECFSLLMQYILNLMENKIGLCSSSAFLIHCGYQDLNLMKGTSYGFNLIILDIRTREITNDYIMHHVLTLYSRAPRMDSK